MATARSADEYPRSSAARIELLARDDMSTEQRTVYDSVVSGPRGRMIGPLLAAIHSPDLAKIWSQFGEFVRYNTCLPKALNELAILVCGRRWGSQVEWWVHARAAAEAGLPEGIITAIRDLQPPTFDRPDQYEIYEFARLLQMTGQVPLELHEAVKARWGTRGAVECTAVIGYYTLVSMTLNAHQIPVPDGGENPLPDQTSLSELPPGRLLP